MGSPVVGRSQAGAAGANIRCVVWSLVPSASRPTSTGYAVLSESTYKLAKNGTTEWPIEDGVAMQLSRRLTVYKRRDGAPNWLHLA